MPFPEGTISQLSVQASTPGHGLTDREDLANLLRHMADQLEEGLHQSHTAVGLVGGTYTLTQRLFEHELSSFPHYVTAFFHFHLLKSQLPSAQRQLHDAVLQRKLPDMLEQLIHNYLDEFHRSFPPLSFIEVCNAYGWRPHMDGATGHLLGFSPWRTQQPHSDVFFHLLAEGQKGAKEDNAGHATSLDAEPAL